MKSFSCAVLVLFLSSNAFAVNIGARLEPFLDDFLIGPMEGDVRLHLHRPQPREVVLVTGEPWEGNTSAYYSIFQDGDKYRMYYRGADWDTEKRKAKHREVTCYAESKDGIHWVKPKLGLFEFNGSKANNIVWDGIGTHCFTPFKDANPNVKPEARYKALSRGRVPKTANRYKSGLFVYQSPDGVRWKMIKEEPVILKGAFDSQNLAFYDTERGLYVDYHRWFNNGVRDIMTCTSKDFVNWTEPVPPADQGGKEGTPLHQCHPALRTRSAHLPRFSHALPAEGRPTRRTGLHDQPRRLELQALVRSCDPGKRSQGPQRQPQQLHGLGPLPTPRQ